MQRASEIIIIKFLKTLVGIPKKFPEVFCAGGRAIPVPAWNDLGASLALFTSNPGRKVLKNGAPAPKSHRLIAAFKPASALSQDFLP
jgi:hypothetical protein